MMVPPVVAVTEPGRPVMSRRKTPWIILAVVLACVSGLPGQGGAMAAEQPYFSDPQTAVSETARMLRARSWRELAAYYDLSGTGIDPEELFSGRFLMRDKRPEIGHPGGFSMYRQPFAPGFSYLFHTTVGDDEIEVTVQIEIDQGGGMIQRGLDSFRMRKSAAGYRLLPKPVR